MTWQTVPLNSSHKKGEFNCGKSLLDDYLHLQASQDFKKQLAVCFVVVDADGHVKGYYTLSNDSLQRTLIPDDLAKKLPYERLPVTLLGRLAVDTRFKGQRIGELLLLDAMRRAYEISKTSVGSTAIVVDPLDDDARRFYRKYDFIDLPGSGRMFIPMKTVGKLFS